jgi:hypothetical protein
MMYRRERPTVKNRSDIPGSHAATYANSVAADAHSAGDPLLPNVHVVEVRVKELRQLFDALDPSPFRERDLDTKAAEFIVSWARELPRDAPLGLLVHLDRAAGAANEAPMLRDAIHLFFRGRATAARQRLRQLLRTGRISLAVGVAFLTAAVAVTQVVGALMEGAGIGDLLSASVIIGGWVAMWRPLEIFLYDWWPIRAEARLYDRLGAMPVSIAYSGAGSREDWQQDWPVAPGTAAAEPRTGATTQAL